NLGQLRRLRRPKRRTRRARRAVQVMAYRVHARTIGEARGFDLRKRPQVAAVDGETGRAITDHRPPARIFEKTLAAQDVGWKGGAILRGRPRVVVAMAAHLVTIGPHAPHQPRVSFGDPTEREEGDTDRMRGEQVEQALRLAFYPRWPYFPLGAVN